MTTTTIDELRERLDEVIDRLAHGGEPVAVTRDGVAIAEMNPTVATEAAPAPTMRTNPPRTPEEREAWWAELKTLQDEIAPLWPEGVSALDAVLEQRREL